MVAQGGWFGNGPVMGSVGITLPNSRSFLARIIESEYMSAPYHTNALMRDTQVALSDLFLPKFSEILDPWCKYEHSYNWTETKFGRTQRV